jgi:hypothetical protein
VTNHWGIRRFLSPRTEARILTFFGETRQSFRRACHRAGPFVFSLSSLFGLLAYTPRFRRTLLQLSSPRDLQLAVGALVGTILTLGFSLSIIPIQRAAEIYTPSIIRLFREARSIRFPFLALLSICLLSFGSVLSPLFGISPTDTIPVLIIFLGVSLDLLRQLYRSVTLLLEPKAAVWRLERQGRDALQRFHQGLEKAADLSWRALPVEKQAEYTRENYLTRFYANNQTHDRTVGTLATELTEIAQKAIERADLSLVFEAIDALRQLVIDSIEIRKSTLVYLPVEVMVVKANAEKPLDRIYECLLAVNRSAVRRASENVSIWVIRAFGQIVRHMMTIRQKPPLEHFASLATGPISYCKMAIRDAMAAGIDDIGYEGAATMATISCNAPAHTTTRDVHLHTLDGVFQIVKSCEFPASVRDCG